MIIISDVTMFTFKRLFAVEKELESERKAVKLLSIKMDNAYLLWRALEDGEFPEEAKRAHYDWTALQHQHLAASRALSASEKRFFAFATKEVEKSNEIDSETDQELL